MADPEVRRYDVRIPAKAADGFDGWFEGTGLMQNSDPTVSGTDVELRDAWRGQRRYRRGGGFTVELPGLSLAAAEVLIEYTGYCLGANEDESIEDEVRGARGVRKAVNKALGREN